MIGLVVGSLDRVVNHIDPDRLGIVHIMFLKTSIFKFYYESSDYYTKLVSSFQQCN